MEISLEKIVSFVISGEKKEITDIKKEIESDKTFCGADVFVSSVSEVTDFKIGEACITVRVPLEFYSPVIMIIGELIQEKKLQEVA